jgi:glycosyltransferase involved in cell wall biosynthesis
LTTALLIFEMNEVDRIISGLRLLESHFDEAVVLDSSSPDEYTRLVHSVTAGTRVYHVPPLGYPDLLRPYAFSKINSEYVLILDADESLSDELVRDLPRLKEYDGYWIPRIDVPRSRTSFHLRLFKKQKYVFDGYIHEMSRVKGNLGRLPRSHCIVHHTETEHLRKRLTRYLEIELFERPEPAVVGKFLSPSARSMPVFFVPLYVLRDATYALHNPTGWAYSASDTMRYIVEKYRNPYRQSRERRNLAVSISRQMRRAGGPIRYLGLDDPKLVESLGEYSERTKLTGVGLFIDLLTDRYVNGSMEKVREGAP